MLGVVAALTLVVVAVWPRESALSCNGFRSLCDRRYNEVTYLTSHNAMASGERGFLAAEQDPDLDGQLDDGVRALMLDLHHWTTPAEAAPVLAALDPEVRAVVAPLVRSVPSRPGVWLCHEICQVGADPAAGQLSVVRQWLSQHPDDVVTLILEDDVSLAEVRATIASAGLDPWLAAPPGRGGAWPTLRQLIESHHTLVVFTQNARAGAGPIRNFYQFAAETPFAARQPGADLRPGRGAATAPLFLVNNWVTITLPDQSHRPLCQRPAFLRTGFGVARPSAACGRTSSPSTSLRSEGLCRSLTRSMPARAGRPEIRPCVGRADPTASQIVAQDRAVFASMSPARRRFVLGVLGLLVLATVVTTALVAHADRAATVRPVAQDRPGPSCSCPGTAARCTSLATLAAALRRAGRDVTLVDLPGGGTGDLRHQAQGPGGGGPGRRSLAGGVLRRRDRLLRRRRRRPALGPGLRRRGLARRVVTLGSPQHGTELAGLAVDVAPSECPTACQQLAPDSTLLRGLNAGDETPAGPEFVLDLDDRRPVVVTPPDSASLAGALDITVQSVCPGVATSPTATCRESPRRHRRQSARARARPGRAAPAADCADSARDVLGGEVGPGRAEEHHDVDDLQQRPRARRCATGSGRGTGRRTTASTGSAGTAAATGAASRVSSSDEPIRNASAPSAAASGESVSVDRNSAIAATPSIDSAT